MQQSCSPYFTPDQMNAHYLKGYEAGSAAAAQAVPEADTMPRTDWETTQGNLLAARKLVCDLWESFPAVRDEIESRTGRWFVWGADRDTGYVGRSVAPPTQGAEGAAPQAGATE